MHRELVALANLEKSPANCGEPSVWCEMVEKYFTTVDEVIGVTDIVNLAEKIAPEM
jgi:hypothetical protein